MFPFLPTIVLFALLHSRSHCLTCAMFGLRRQPAARTCLCRLGGDKTFVLELLIRLQHRGAIDFET